MALMVVAATLLTSCEPDYQLWVSSQDLRFDLASETQTIILRANCKWTIDVKDNPDWLTISPMSGSATDSIITVTVNDYHGGDYRGTTFTINSPKYHVHRTVFVAQTYIDFYSIINKVFGVMIKERWNTDYFDQIVEDSYTLKEYDPYDTMRGYRMYFLEDGSGVQRDHHTDTVAYWLFYYEYDPINQILHIDFPVDSTAHGDFPESYSPEVLSATDSLYRFMHEFKPHFFERVDMRRVGTIVPAAKASMIQKAVRRKERGPIFLD